MRFLKWYVAEEFRNNIFTEDYGTDRAFADGKAKTAENFHILLTGLK